MKGGNWYWLEPKNLATFTPKNLNMVLRDGRNVVCNEKVCV